MYRLFAFALVVTCFGHVISTPVNACASSEDWCESYWTAVKCGVLEFCKETAWKKTVEAPAKVNTTAASPVTVTLYFESLCPGCKQFIMYQAFPAYTKLASTGILDLKFVPYGNAQEIPYGSSYYYNCQHGPQECLGNEVEACAMQLYQEPAQYVPFIHCFEYYGMVQAQYCATTSKMNWASISSCAYGAEGLALMHEMAVATAALNPPHQYVPWITINGVHTDAMQSSIMANMVSFVCNTYTGTKPAACTQHEKESKVCYKTDVVA